MISRLQPRNADGRTSAADRRPILVVPYMWIGAFVRCHSVVKLLKARYPALPVDVPSTTLCAPLADYMPELRQAIVVDLPRKRLSWGEHAALAERLKREHYGTALIMPRTWKAALAPFLAGVPERVGWVGEWRFGLLNDVRFGEKQRPRMIDQCAALALPKETPLRTEWPLPELRVPPTEIEGWRERMGLRGTQPAVALAPGAVGPSKRRPAPSYAAVARPPARASRYGSSSVRAKSRSLPTSLPRPAHSHAISPALICATRCSRSRRPMWRCRTIRACCMWGPRSARRRSVFSDRPARGTGRRSIRSPRRCRPRRNSIASLVTSRPAARAITAACATSRLIKCWRSRGARSPRRDRPNLQSFRLRRARPRMTAPRRADRQPRSCRSRAARAVPAPCR